MSGRTRFAAVVMGAALVLGGMAGPASANHDRTPETNAQRCDTWYRGGHGGGAGTSHDHSAPNDEVSAGGITVHAHSGHYVVRGPGAYLEVVGGSYYSTGSPQPGLGAGNQGGYVQGEVDPGAPIPADADFHFNFFADGKHGECVSVANNKAGNEGDDPYH
jgi:hypothetical protein